LCFTDCDTSPKGRHFAVASKVLVAFQKAKEKTLHQLAHMSLKLIFMKYAIEPMSMSHSECEKAK
jgi:hypothetical protein